MSEGKQDESKKEEKPEEDLTGDGGVMKKLIKEGQSWERPKGGAEVRLWTIFLIYCVYILRQDVSQQQLVGSSSLCWHAPRWNQV